MACGFVRFWYTSRWFLLAASPGCRKSVSTLVAAHSFCCVLCAQNRCMISYDGVCVVCVGVCIFLNITIYVWLCNLMYMYLHICVRAYSVVYVCTTSYLWVLDPSEWSISTSQFTCRIRLRPPQWQLRSCAWHWTTHSPECHQPETGVTWGSAICLYLLQMFDKEGRHCPQTHKDSLAASRKMWNGMKWC